MESQQNRYDLWLFAMKYTTLSTASDGIFSLQIGQGVLKKKKSTKQGR